MIHRHHPLTMIRGLRAEEVANHRALIVTMVHSQVTVEDINNQATGEVINNQAMEVVTHPRHKVDTMEVHHRDSVDIHLKVDTTSKDHQEVMDTHLRDTSSSVLVWAMVLKWPWVLVVVYLEVCYWVKQSMAGKITNKWRDMIKATTRVMTRALMMVVEISKA